MASANAVLHTPIAVDQPGGFTQIAYTSGYAIDSFLGVGAQTGFERVLTCPQNTVVTGIAGGASPDRNSQGWISNLQLQCRWVRLLVLHTLFCACNATKWLLLFGYRNPLSTSSRIQTLLRSKFPRLTRRLSCKVWKVGCMSLLQAGCKSLFCRHRLHIFIKKCICFSLAAVAHCYRNRHMDLRGLSLRPHAQRNHPRQPQRQSHTQRRNQAVHPPV